MFIAVFLLSLELAFAVGLLAYLFVKKPKVKKFLFVAQGSKMVFAAFIFVSMYEVSIKTFHVWVLWLAIGITIVSLIVMWLKGVFATAASIKKILPTSQGQTIDPPQADQHLYQ